MTLLLTCLRACRPLGVATWVALAALCAHAAPVTYTFEGRFTGQTSGDAALAAQLSPLLTAGEVVRETLTYDTNIPADGSGQGGRARYHAITATSVQFAGFQDAVPGRFSACSNAGEFFCSIYVGKGTGLVPNHFAPDAIDLFPSGMSSAAFDAASARSLGLQFMLFFVDVTGQSLLDESLNFDPTALRRSGWYGSLGVAAVGAQGLEYANFLFSVDRIQAGAAGPNAVPEPTGVNLMAAALAAALLAVRRRPHTLSRSTS